MMHESNGSTFVGIDIGGTNTVIGLYDSSLRLLAKKTMATNDKPQQDGTGIHPTDFFDRLHRAVMSIADRSAGGWQDVHAVGMGVPGRVDSVSGTVLRASNLGWRSVPVADEMSRRLHRPVLIDNDVRMYTYGEAMAGAGQGCRHLIGLTIGTGLAAGIMLEGQLIQGSHHYAGEIGHDPVPGNDRKCKCGNIGCLETIVSAPGMTKRAREAIEAGEDTVLARRNLEEITALHLYEACRAGDPLCRRIFRETALILADKLLTLALAVDPEVIIIGGGVAAAGSVLLDPIRQRFEQEYMHRSFVPDIVQAKLGDEAGLIGSAHKAKLRFGSV